MIHDIPAPKLSANFTIDDIRKIRECNFKRLKDATIEERLKDIRAHAEPMHTTMQNDRLTKKGHKGQKIL